jgi:hypothetical protein
MRAHPTRNNSDNRDYKRASNDNTHRLTDTQSQSKKRRPSRPCRIISTCTTTTQLQLQDTHIPQSHTCNNPIPSKTLPSPRSPILWNRYQIPITPLRNSSISNPSETHNHTHVGILIISMFINRTFQLSRPIRNSLFRFLRNHSCVSARKHFFL